MNEKKTLYLYPLILSAIIIISDQLTKFLVLRFIPVYSAGPDDIKRIIGEDFLWFINISNRGAMFSLAINSTGLVRSVVLFILPIVLIMYMLYIVIYSSWEKRIRWVAAGIVGGGIGNMLDRILREEGVVDFISVKIYGLFGLERWPTFNIADSAVVVSMFFWVALIIFPHAFSKKRSLADDGKTEFSE